MRLMSKNRVLMWVASAALCVFASPAMGQFTGAPGPMGQGYPGAGYSMMGPGPGMMMPAQAAGSYFPVQQASGEMAEGYAGGGCGTGSCNDCCLDCCSCQGWCHKLAVYAEFLYLRPRNSEVAYGVEVNSAIAPPTPDVQVGRIGVADLDYQPGWRGGVTYVLDPYSSITAQYTMFEAGTDDRVDVQGTATQVMGLVFHPNTLSANSGGIFAEASYDMSFDLIDLEYRELLSYGCFHQVNMLIGARYANLEQQFDMLSAINGQATVSTDVDFDGLGIRLGLEGERYTRRGFMAYAKSHGSLIAGEFRANYQQGNAFDASVVDTDWEAGRIVPMLDLETGIGWTSANGYWRFSAGYVYSAWYNVVKTDEWINTVQANDFVGLGNSDDDVITFDGLVGRIETRF